MQAEKLVILGSNTVITVGEELGGRAFNHRLHYRELPFYSTGNTDFCVKINNVTRGSLTGKTNEPATDVVLFLLVERE